MAGQAHSPRPRVWPLLVELGRVARLSLAVASLLVAAWLVPAGLRVVFTGEGGDTWLLVAGLAWLLAALRYPPLLTLRADVADMEPTLPRWPGNLGVSGLGYAVVGRGAGILPCYGCNRWSTRPGAATRAWCSA